MGAKGTTTMRYKGKDLDLQEYVEERKNEYLASGKTDWTESEEYIWSIQEYLSSCGPLNEKDRDWLFRTDPELLELDDSLREEEEAEEDATDRNGVTIEEGDFVLYNGMRLRVSEITREEGLENPEVTDKHLWLIDDESGRKYEIFPHECEKAD